MRVIGNTYEWRRIKALPRRSYTQDEINHIVLHWTKALKLPHGTEILKPHQAITIQESTTIGGALCAIGVGGGKSFLSVLLPVAFQAKRPLLLVPAHLKKTTEKEVLPKMAKHWQLHPNLVIESYAKISTKAGVDFLEEYNPDLILADEAHKLKNQKSARTKRFLRFFRGHDHTVFIPLTGTLTKNSLLDYYHLAWLGLRYYSPVPRIYQECELWDLVLSPKSENDYFEKVDPGVLRELDPFDVRRGFANRLTQTPGVIITQDSSCDASISIKKVLDIPMYTGYYEKCKDTWELPDGEWICDALQYWQKMRQLSLGFFYTWETQPPEPWLEARRNWFRVVREFITKNRRKIDTIGTYTQWIEETNNYPSEYLEWMKIEPMHSQKKVTYWFDESVIDYVMGVCKSDSWLIWVDSNAVGYKFQERGLRYFSAGDKDETALLEYKDQKSIPKEPIVLKIQSHGTGRNLQRFRRNMVLPTPSAGDVWEQLIGRTHRAFQTADEIEFIVPLHTQFLRDNFERALMLSRYEQQTTHQKQKLLLATIH